MNLESFVANSSGDNLYGKDAEGFDTDVITVGLGPGGATAALALATYGIRVHAVSMFPSFANSPRAHACNQRAAEVMRDLGVEEDAKLRGTPWDQIGDTLMTTSLAGRELLRIRTYGTGDDRHGDYVQASPSPMLDIPQPELEPVLIEHAAKRGAIISFNTQYLGHEQDADGVTVRFVDLRTGQQFTQRARYLLGFDGARSQIAEELGLEFEGELGRAGTVYVTFDADLSKYVAHRPAILHWIFNANAGFGEIGMGLLRCVTPWTRWIAGWGYNLEDGEPDLPEEYVVKQIRSLVGDPDLPVTIVKKSNWLVNQQWALRYSSGRVFCGGDAVHRHPPSNGLGANTSMQDAFNLAWKVAYVIRGYAGPRLLDSYDEERVPIGKQIVARANKSRVEFAGVRQWFDHSSEDPVAAGIERLREASLEGAELRDRTFEALEVKNYEWNAHGVELNQRYESSALLAEEGIGTETWDRDPELYAQPTTRPGAKIPHAWLVDERGHRVSTLDLVGRGRYTLVTGLAGQAWTEAAHSLGLPFLHNLVIGEVGSEDPYGNWWRIRDMHEAGAILVRPDGVIAWRHSEALVDPAEAGRLLRAALDRVLDRAMVRS